MVTVAPGVPVPEMVLSVELTPAPGILFAVAGIVGVTTGAAGRILKTESFGSSSVLPSL